MKPFALGAVRASLPLALVLAAGCSGGGSSTDPADAEILVAPIAGPVTEAGGETSYTIVLNAKPKSDVTIALSSTDETEGTVSPASLTFTGENWDAPQTVLVTGVDDPVADGNESFDIEMTITTSDARYSILELDPVAVLNLDDETAGVRVGPVAGVTSEFGDQIVIPVVLQSQPLSDVVLIFGTSDLTEGQTDTLTMTFTSVNWNAPQNITVTGQDDEVPDGLVNYSVLFQNAASEDPAYGGLPIPAVALGNVDNDSPGIIISPLIAASNETDDTTASVTLQVRLSTPPAANVTVSFQSTDTAEGDLRNLTDTGFITTLVLPPFTTTNWNVPQTVRVCGEDDSTADGDQPYTVIISDVTSTDTAYATVARPIVNLVNLDNDSPGIRVTPLSGIADETGGFMAFTIDLLTEPTSDVTIGMSVSDPSEAAISHSSHTFTTVTWDNPVTVWLSGVADRLPDGNQPWSVVFAPAVSSDTVYAGRKPANLIGHTLDTEATRRAVVYDDAMGTEADNVLVARGWVVTIAATTTELENAVDAGGVDLVVVESSTGALPPSTESSLATYVSGGGRLILSHWDLDMTATLAAALDVSTTPYLGHRFVFPQPVGFIDLFEVQQDFPFPLTGQDVVVDNGQELATGSGVLVARVDSLSGPGSVAVTNSGRVIVNGFAPDDMTGTDNDGDGVPDMRELYDNEFAYLFKSGSPASFSSTRPLGVNNMASTQFLQSKIRVLGVPTAVTKVTISLHTQHTSNADLDLFLLGPNGTRLELTTDSGSTGDDFGVGCRTGDGKLTFDDAAASAVLPSTGPVVGSFRPEGVGGLAVFNGINPNGEWTLEAADDITTSQFGTIKCWSVNLTF